ncbi:MAG: hypothetical protein JSV18_03790 [Candidatus Bathyarchaeota archaeon]|nr:MAG: hypothetical protein JSV18_03790 [Candidatus Bathyarchaeota archaeon]
MSEALKRFITSVRGLWKPSEEEPLQKLPEMEPDEREESDEPVLSTAARFEMEREVEG